tara:strand:+ start:765 stop:2222 length:1458 start_codon:yes stop_codon:yes gene_type:complete
MTSQIQDLVISDLNLIPLTNTISFDYVRPTDVKVSVGTTVSNLTQKTYIQDWTITNDNKVQFATNVFTATGTYKVSIFRQTDATTPSHSFQAGSSIRADDLNNVNKQTLFVADEVRNTLNSLALGSNPTGEQLLINGANIADDSITSSKIDNLEVKTADLDDLAVTTEKINNSAVTSAKIEDGTIVNDDIADNTIQSGKILNGTLLNSDINASAAIAGTKISPDFGSQNITTTGTTTTGSLSAGTTTSQNATITNNLTLSSGNNDNKGLIFPTDIGGGSGDKAYIRYFVDGTGENTRLKIGIENDAEDDIYLQGGLVHTSSNFSVNGTCTANSFSGDGANLTNLLIGIRQVKETVSNGQNNTTSETFVDKCQVQLTNVASSSRVLVLSTCRLWSSTPYSSTRYAEAITTVGNSGTFAGNTNGSQKNSEDPNHANAYMLPVVLWDTSNTAGTRTYKIRFRKHQGNVSNTTAYISQARIMAIELRAT